MKCGHIWRNCLVSELNIPEKWYNKDGLQLKPARCDLFLVYVPLAEVDICIMPYIVNLSHVQIVTQYKNSKPTDDMIFLVSRNRKYIQLWPYLTLNEPGNVWELFGTKEIPNLAALETLGIKDYPGDI